MKVQHRKRGLVCLLLGGLCTVPALGEEWDFQWKSPCVGGKECLFNDLCWCEGDWSDAANWSGLGSPPPGSTSSALIERSNYSTGCSGQNSEHWLQVDLADDAVGTVRIRAECCVWNPITEQCAGSDQLRLAFWGGKLTVYGAFQINGNNGPVIVELAGGGSMKTE